MQIEGTRAGGNGGSGQARAHIHERLSLVLHLLLHLLHDLPVLLDLHLLLPRRLLVPGDHLHALRRPATQAHGVSGPAVAARSARKEGQNKGRAENAGTHRTFWSAAVSTAGQICRFRPA